jgi:hypothetical protein
LVLLSCSTQVAGADIEYGSWLYLNVVVTFQGSKVVGLAKINLKNPDENDEVGWGTAAHYTGADRTKKNCRGEFYDYGVLELDPNWTSDAVFVGPKENLVFLPNVVATIANNKEYWDLYYAGYQGPQAGEPQCGYSQNCHGYAFGVGDWPDKAVVLLNVQGEPGGLPAPGGGNQQPCYDACDADVAVIASDVVNHSIKVEGGVCVTTGLVPPGFPVPPLVITKVVKKSWEKCRESGVYWRVAGDCPDSLDLNKAHTPHLAFPNQPNDPTKLGLGPFSFGFYKKH